MGKIEKLDLAVAALSGDIYLAEILEDETMSEDRREFTSATLRAATQWFMANDEKMVQFETDNDDNVYLFHTSDKDKAKRILDILFEDEEDAE